MHIMIVKTLPVVLVLAVRVSIGIEGGKGSPPRFIPTAGWSGGDPAAASSNGGSRMVFGRAAKVQAGLYFFIISHLICVEAFLQSRACGQYNIPCLSSKLQTDIVSLEYHRLLSLSVKTDTGRRRHTRALLSFNFATKPNQWSPPLFLFPKRKEDIPPEK